MIITTDLLEQLNKTKGEKMKITKVNEKVINLEKDNQTITITWKEMLYLLDEFIYAAEGTKKEIKSEVLDL